MNFYLLLSLILIAISGLFSLTRQFQMLQQNSYFPSRYFGWVKGGYTVELAISSIAFCLSSLLFSRKLYELQLCFVITILIIRIIFAVKIQKKSIKKLSVTARIKRLYGTAFIFLTLLIFGFVFTTDRLSEVFAIIAFMMSFISPILTILCRTINAPFEKSVAQWYINDAKRILKEHNDLIVIGVTGSYGKTSTKFILSRILSERYNVVATPQSFNTPMGVVRTIREILQPQTQIFICEMGAKNVGDIKKICDIVHPDYGIITSVGAQHLETFKSVDNIFKTKFELANAVKKNGGEVFVNGDSEEIMKRINPDDFNVYGTDKNYSFCAKNLSYGRNGSEFRLVLENKSIEISSKLLGRHSILNIIGACAVAHKLLVEPNDIKFACSTLKATEHRLELKPYINSSLLIDDAYNANPEGCIEAIRVIGSFGNMKKVIITPGLVELGDKEYDCNFALGLEAAKFCDIIILVGKNRSKPMLNAINTTDFNSENIYVVSGFKEAMGIYSKIADSNTVVLFENDLPDNYLN